MNHIIFKMASPIYCMILLPVFFSFCQDSMLNESVLNPQFESVNNQDKIENVVLFNSSDSFQSNKGYEISNDITQDSLVIIEINDGSSFKGSIVNQDETKIYFKTINGIEASIPKSVVKKIKPMEGKIVKGNYQSLDPNYSRLLFGPTARPLKKGEGYFSDYYVLFPGISYGITNNLSLMAGFSLIPGLGFDEQLFYLAPKLGINVNDKFAVAAGALYMNAKDVSAGIGFTVATYGERDKSITLGLGLGYTKESEEDLKFAEHPIIMFGGNARLSNSIALVSENWIITGSDFDISQQPFSIAARFFGEHISVDFGFIIILDVIKEGFPIPWLSFVYNFGN